jgi:SagB-type dehydrogenase family enzyme
MVPIGQTKRGIPAASEMPHLGLPTVPLSRTEVDYPDMRAIHEASSLNQLEEIKSEPEPRKSLDLPRNSPSDSIEQVILRRGSSRQFDRQPITLDQLQTILDSATRGIPADFPAMNDLYLIVNAVDGLNPGAYFYDGEARTLLCLKEGNFRDEARHLGLGQDLPGDAAADVFFLADLNSILGRHGNRGYRAVQLEAGILGGKMYLGAYAQHIGATGLTFFDDDVTDFFKPHAEGKSAIFLVALGKGRKMR